MIYSLLSAIALAAVWGAVVAINVFWALPVHLQSKPMSKASDEVNNISEKGDTSLGGISCHRTMRMDPLTNSCYIPCVDWEWRTETENQLRQAATYITTVVTIICSIIAGTTWIKLKHLWSFPVITPLYILLASAAFALLATIPYTFSRQAFCSDEDFLISVKNPTSFCIVLGTIRHYLLFVLLFWATFTYGNLWWIVKFPTKGKLLFQNKRKIHILQAIVSWGCPIIPVTAVYAFNGRYSQGITFPYVCYPSSPSLFYYTLLLPMQLFIATICILLIWTSYLFSKQVIANERLLICPPVSQYLSVHLSSLYVSLYEVPFSLSARMSVCVSVSMYACLHACVCLCIWLLFCFSI